MTLSNRAILATDQGGQSHFSSKNKSYPAVPPMMPVPGLPAQPQSLSNTRSHAWKKIKILIRRNENPLKHIFSCKVSWACSILFLVLLFQMSERYVLGESWPRHKAVYIGYSKNWPGSVKKKKSVPDEFYKVTVKISLGHIYYKDRLHDSKIWPGPVKKILWTGWVLIRSSQVFAGPQTPVALRNLHFFSCKRPHQVRTTFLMGLSQCLLPLIK